MAIIEIEKMYVERPARYVNDLCGIDVTLSHVNSGITHTIHGKKSGGLPFSRVADLPEGRIVWSSSIPGAIFEAKIDGRRIEAAA